VKPSYGDAFVPSCCQEPAALSDLLWVMPSEPFICPQYRVTLSHGGRLLLTDWEPWLLRDSGPCNRLLEAEHARPIADLTLTREDDRCELIVAELGRRADPGLRAALIDWATLLGYRRVWFRGEVVEVEPAGAGAGRRVATTCQVCDSTWTEDSPEFWLSAQHNGVFPYNCPSCGHRLPQWSLAPEPAEADADAPEPGHMLAAAAVPR
jgi:hypothetical protein